VQELRADAPVHPHGAGDRMDIRANGLSEVGHLIDEGDLSASRSGRSEPQRERL
jgi:hypothetical protein